MKTKLLTLLLLFVPLMVFADPSPTPYATSSIAEVCKNATADKLQSALADVVNKSVQLAGDAKDFLVAQLPDVIRQLLAWKFYESITPMLFWGLLFVIGLLRVGSLIRAEDFSAVETETKYGGTETSPKNGYAKMIWGIAKCVLTLVSGIIFILSLNLHWLQIWVAPKVYLIEYAKTMVTGH